MKKKVAIVFGGRSLESDISVITAMQVFQNIDKSLYDVECVFAFEGDFYLCKLDSAKRFAPFEPCEHKKVFLLHGEFFALKRNRLYKYSNPTSRFCVATEERAKTECCKRSLNIIAFRIRRATFYVRRYAWTKHCQKECLKVCC